MFAISPQNRREGTFHIHQKCTHIYLIYISTHPAVLFWKRKDNSAKTCTCGGLIAIVLFSFLFPLWCLPNTVDLNEEKSLMTPLSFKSNQVDEDVSFYRNDWINEGLVCVCFFWSKLCLKFNLWPFISLFLSFFFFSSRKGLLST